MSNLIKELGLEEDKVQWYHLSACKNMSINWFYDDYEDDKQLAMQIDELCLHCPVATFCLIDGVENKDKGVRGGIYLDLGRVDKNHNKHKTQETWKALKKLHGKNFL
jgi:hypothetical protein